MEINLRKLLTAAVFSALASSPAFAKECKGVTFPDQVQSGGTTLVLNGLGLRQASAFKVSVYVAGLYVAQTSTDGNAILASNSRKELVLQFVRDVGASDLSKAWQEGFELTAKAQIPALNERIEKLKGWMAAMKNGERLIFVAKQGGGIEVNVNGTVKGTIDGDDFAKAFLSMWLGATPVNPAMKAGLLGSACA